jgi:hypothetical protein
MEVPCPLCYPIKSLAADKNESPHFFGINYCTQDSSAEFRNTLLRDLLLITPRPVLALKRRAISTDPSGIGKADSAFAQKLFVLYFDPIHVFPANGERVAANAYRQLVVVHPGNQGVVGSDGRCDRRDFHCVADFHAVATGAVGQGG